MKKRYSVILLSLIITVFTFLIAFTGCLDSGGGTTKVLFIGNSFTYYSDVPQLFSKIATGAGKKVRVDSVTQGSWTLTKFADENDEYGAKVDEKLKSSSFDAVVLQEQSTRTLDNYTAFLKAVRSLQTKINDTQENCKIYLYSTWGYADEANARGLTIPEMEKKIREAYKKAADELNVSVSYVGKAFSAVYSEYPEYNLYYSDNKHQSYTGAFLSACVHVATILDCDPRASTFIGELDTDTATAMKNAAYEAVFGT